MRRIIISGLLVSGLVGGAGNTGGLRQPRTVDSDRLVSGLVGGAGDTGGLRQPRTIDSDRLVSRLIGGAGDTGGLLQLLRTVDNDRLVSGLVGGTALATPVDCGSQGPSTVLRNRPTTLICKHSIFVVATDNRVTYIFKNKSHYTVTKLLVFTITFKAVL